MPLLTKPFDAAEYLRTPEAIAAYLTVVLEDGSSAEIDDALETVVRARQMHGIAQDEPSEPVADGKIDALRQRLNALGLRLQVAAA